MIETLFFSCYNAYLRKDLKDARVYFEMLRDELRKTNIKDPLHPAYLTELKKIRDSIATNSFINSSWVEDDTPQRIPKPSDDMFTGNQDDLVRKIHYEAEGELKSLLNGGDGFRLYNIEHPCGIYGAVDMVYTDGTTHYPVEVKKDEGKHDLIGQISKYDLFFKLRLNLKKYRKVSPVTICASYQNNVVKELKSNGVLVLYYWVNEGRVRLVKV